MKFGPDVLVKRNVEPAGVAYCILVDGQAVAVDSIDRALQFAVAAKLGVRFELVDP